MKKMDMNNKMLWIIIAAVVVIILIFVMGSVGNGVAPVNTNTTASTQDTSVQPKTFTPKATGSTAPIAGMNTSLGGIFATKGNYECDYDSVTNSTRTSNTVYLSDGRMRGEFRTIEAGASKSTIVVYDGTYVYTWTEGQATGKISQPKTLADLPGIIPTDVSSGRILGSGLNSVSWNCHAWSLDQSKIVRPPYVTFN